MPFNGSGTFVRLYNWTVDALNAINISSSRMDNEMNGMATALTDCVTRDGQSPMLANLPMNGFKATGLAPGVDPTDAVNMSQIQSVNLLSHVIMDLNSLDQTLVTTAAEQVLFTPSLDSLTEYAAGTFTARFAGVYEAVMTWSPTVAGGVSLTSYIYHNGGAVAIKNSTTLGVPGTIQQCINLAANDTIAFYAQRDATANKISGTVTTTYASIMRIQ